MSRRGAACVIATSLALEGLTCGNPFSSGQIVEFEPVGTTQAGVLGSEMAVISESSHHFTETSAMAVRSLGASPAWELLATGDPFLTSNGAFDPTVKAYGCSRDGGATWRTLLYTGVSNHWGDATSFYRSGSSIRTAYIVSLSQDHNGIWMWSSAEPCPATGFAQWYFYSAGLASDGTVDYPNVAYYGTNDKAAIVWTQRVGGVGGHAQLTAGVINADGSGISGIVVSPCLPTHEIRYPRAAADVNGWVHIVYQDQADGTIRQDQFNPYNRNVSLSKYLHRDVLIARQYDVHGWRSAGLCRHAHLLQSGKQLSRVGSAPPNRH